MEHFEPKTFNHVRHELRETDAVSYNRLQLIGKLLAIRSQQKLSQEKLSSLSGVAKKTISRMENAIDETSLETIALLADAMGYELQLVKKKHYV